MFILASRSSMKETRSASTVWGRIGAPYSFLPWCARIACSRFRRVSSGNPSIRLAAAGTVRGVGRGADVQEDGLRAVPGMVRRTSEEAVTQPLDPAVGQLQERRVGPDGGLDRERSVAEDALEVGLALLGRAANLVH